MMLVWKLRSSSACYGVVLVGVDRAHDLVAVHHRGGAPAQECLAVVAAVEGVVAPQGLCDLRIKGVDAHGRCPPSRVS